MALDPPFELVVGLNGDIAINTRDSDGPSPYVQALPQLLNDPQDALQELEDEYLTPRLAGAAADITKAGYIFNTTWRDPHLWTEPFAPSTALELDLPDEDAEGRITFREVEIGDVDAAANLGSVLRRPTAAQGTREYVRGSMASMPFTPGGEPIQAGSTAAMRAAEEASTGLWLRQLEAPGGPPEALAPGMPYSLYAQAVDPVNEAPAEALSSSSGAKDKRGHGDAYPPQNGALDQHSSIKAARPATYNGNAGREENDGLKVELGDMFKGIWLLDEEDAEQGSEAQSWISEENTKEERNESSIARLEGVLKLPDGNGIPGAADPTADQLLSTALPKRTWGSATQESIAAPPIAAASPAKRKPSDHEWAIRGGIANLAASFDRLRPNLAMSYPFELDTFQKEAVLHLEQGHSVFVAAHTSAGKTVVAEYAFALAKQHCTRAIYTSPIKTISNQKFRDFSNDFEVGLLTGDVSIKPEAPCLIMTTEILRSMLYKGADIIRDIEWVIFDECHYVNDVERGVVWEEVIIMLPAHVNLVLLSATVPNVMEFADWVGRTKRKRIYVTGTTRRPVPLEHNLYYNGQLYTIARQDVFLSEGSSAARKAWKAKNAPPPMTTKEAKAARPTGRGDGGRGAPPGRGGRGGPPARGGHRGSGHGRSITAESGGAGGARSGVKSERTAWMELIKLLDKKQLLPAVVFCFSKKRVDVLADTLQTLDFTTASEKSEIQVFFEKAITRLKGNDRKLPQILRLREMLRRGLGVHHAGLLPIMKEVVEMLFCRGVIKFLFSTETFAMGVNAPARTVVFQGLRKHDGKAFRTLLPGEYTQMAGRAGRRGLDAVGTVVIGCWDDVPEEGELKTLLLGRATRLESRFRLTYTMILNLLRVEDLKVEDMLKRSFAEFHAQRAAPEALAAVEKGQAALAAVRVRPFPAAFMGTTKEDVREFHDITARIDELSEAVQGKVMGSRAAQQALVPGRLVLLTDSNSRLPELAVICGTPPSMSGRGLLVNTASSGASGRYYVLSLHQASPLDKQESEQPEVSNSQQNDSLSQGLPAGFTLKAAGPKRGTSSPGPLPRKGDVGGVEYVLKEVSASDIQDICRAKLKVEADEILDPHEPQALTAAVRQLHSAAEAAAEEGGSPPILDPEKDLKINQLELVTAIRERQRLVQIRAAMPCQREPGFGEMWALVRSEALLEGRLARLAHQLSDANLAQMPEFHQRVNVLRQLEYAAPDDTVLMKGRVACELNAGDELVTTEIIFAGVLSELTPEEAVAVLSALVFQEKSEMEGNAAPNDRLEEARGHMLSLAHQAGEVQKACGLDIVPEDFCRETLKFGLMEVVYRWALGDPFDDISALTDIMEGSIVRTVVRLDEMCRQLRDAARVMGNTALFEQMEAGSAAIKRDVVFAASLYVN